MHAPDTASVAEILQGTQWLISGNQLHNSGGKASQKVGLKVFFLLKKLPYCPPTVLE